MRHGRGIIQKPIIKKALPGRPGVSGRLTQVMPHALPGRVYGSFTHNIDGNQRQALMIIGMG